MKKAVIYSRVSTQEQSFQSQIDELQKYSQYSNIQIVDIFAEKVSGYDLKANRSEYDRMKDYVIDNSINLIICWELSRFGRNALHTRNEIAYFQNKGIDIYFKKENIYTLSKEPMTALVLDVVSRLAEMERDSIVARSVRGKLSSARLGKRIGFPIMPYGFDADQNGYIVINEEEAKYVRMMYEMAATGVSLRQIANKLNSLNVPTRNTLKGRKRTLRSGQVVSIVWKTNTLRKILKSTLYKGERNYKDEVIVQIPQIVSVDLWDKTQAIFSNHIGYVNKNKYDYLFKGKLYCGKCGYIIAARTERLRQGMPSYYFCTARRESGVSCKSGQFDSKVFDELIYTQLFKNPAVLEKVYEETAKEFNLEEKKIQIEYFKGEIVRQEAKKNRVNNLYKEGFIDESEVRQEHTAIRNSTLEMENNIARIEKEISNHNEVEIGTLLFQLVDETNYAIKRDFVVKYVDKVVMYNVQSNDLNWNELYSGRTEDEHWWEGDMVQLKKPHGNDKLIYVEVFAFGNPRPLKISLTNVTRQCFISDKLHYENGHLSVKQ